VQKLFRALVVFTVLAAVPTLVSAQCVDLPTDLASWWPGEGNAFDIQGGHSGVLQNGTTFAAGQVGQAFSLDGTDDFVLVPASPGLDVGTEAGLTIATWINPTSVAGNNPIFEWSANSNVGGSVGGHLFVLAGGALYANLVQPPGGGANFHQIQSAPAVVGAGAFQHVAVTYDKTSGSASLYRNGVSVSTTNLGSFTTNTTQDVYIGARVSNEFGDGGARVVGLIDELQLFRRGLSQAEIQSIYDAGIDGICTDGAGPCPACGDSDEPCCGTACGAGLVCSAATCVACGADGEPCCGSACDADLLCSAGTCGAAPGFVPPDKPTAKCENAVNKKLAKLAACVAKCHAKQADALLAAKPFDIDVCTTTDPGACRTKFDAAMAGLAAAGICPPCLDSTDQAALADQVTQGVHSRNGLIYCAGTTPLP